MSVLRRQSEIWPCQRKLCRFFFILHSHEAQEQALVQMAEVKECESQQMAQLSEMIDQELEFARQYYTIMNELRSSLSQP